MPKANLSTKSAPRVAALVGQQQLAIQFAKADAVAINNGPSKRSHPPAWIAYLFLVIALSMGTGGLVLLADTVRFVRSAVTATGSVIELERRKCDSKDTSTCYAPRVLFTEETTGRRIDFVSATSSNPAAFHVGEQVTVLYSPGRAETAALQGLFSIWGGVIVLSGIGIVFAFFGVCVLLCPDKFKWSAGNVASNSPGGCPVDNSAPSADTQQASSIGWLDCGEPGDLGSV
jgi:Protein of unknown function (DUF3592)